MKENTINHQIIDESLERTARALLEQEHEHLTTLALTTLQKMKQEEENDNRR